MQPGWTTQDLPNSQTSDRRPGESGTTVPAGRIIEAATGDEDDAMRTSPLGCASSRSSRAESPAPDLGTARDDERHRATLDDRLALRRRT